jgi:hypothetical protein
VDQGEHRTPVPAGRRRAGAKALRREPVDLADRHIGSEVRRSFAEVEVHRTGSEVHRNLRVVLRRIAAAEEARCTLPLGCTLLGCKRRIVPRANRTTEEVHHIPQVLPVGAAGSRRCCTCRDVKLVTGRKDKG